MKASRKPQVAAEQSLQKLVSTRGTVIIGYVVASFFVLTFLIWGGSIPLTSAAIASGVVGVEGHKKQVQHLEGGIVSKIHVRDGDVVSKGQILLTLNDIEVRSQYNELNSRYIQVSAEYARWSAEQIALDTIDIPDWLIDNQDQQGVVAAISRQSDILLARLAVIQQTTSNLQHKLSESIQEAEAAKARIVNLKRKKQLIENELVEFTRLRKSGFATRSQLFDLEKQITTLELEIGDSESSIKLAKQKEAQYGAQIAELKSTQVQESVEEAARALKERDALRQQLASIRNQLERSVIAAPIAGYILNSVINTVGGVVSPGSTIMEILPKDERLLVNGRVPPKDRDSIRVGQRAEVRFSAFSRRSTLPVEGKVKLISADSVIDPVTSLPYYSTTIELNGDPSEALNGEVIFPGMQADILIITGAQTFLQYLASPITRSFNRAFRES